MPPEHVGVEPGSGSAPAWVRRSRLGRRAQRVLAEADVVLDGGRPWDVQIHDRRLLGRVFRSGSLGLGESYMDGWWDVEELDGFFERILAAGLDRSIVRLPVIWNVLRNKVYNLQRGARAFRIGKSHYDIGNELYEAMLDRRMVYSCGYWNGAGDLDAAQEAKLDLICRKLHLEPGMRILDIGCGWGSLVRYAAEKYDIDAVGLTVSRQQADRARSRYRGLPVEIRYQDYRDLQDDAAFDRVVSVGMFEHVGHKNYAEYMRVAHRALREDGLHLLHTIGRGWSSTLADPWISRYIFPNSMLPSMAQITRAADRRFVLEDVHNIGPHYDPTLMAWCRRFERNWNQIQDTEPAYDERFRRMWRYYLLSSAGAFRAGRLQVWQIVMAKDKGHPGGYRPVR